MNNPEKIKLLEDLVIYVGRANMSNEDLKKSVKLKVKGGILPIVLPEITGMSISDEVVLDKIIAPSANPVDPSSNFLIVKEDSNRLNKITHAISPFNNNEIELWYDVKTKCMFIIPSLAFLGNATTENSFDYSCTELPAYVVMDSVENFDNVQSVNVSTDKGDIGEYETTSFNRDSTCIMISKPGLIKTSLNKVNYGKSILDGQHKNVYLERMSDLPVVLFTPGEASRFVKAGKTQVAMAIVPDSFNTFKFKAVRDTHNTNYMFFHVDF